MFVAVAAYVMVTSYGANQQLLAIAASVFAAAVISSVAGFAFSAICGAILLHLIDDPVRCVEIMMICSIAGQSLMVWSLRRNIDWRRLGVFLAGAFLGLPVGLFVLLKAKAGYAHGIGFLLIAYALFMLFRPSLVLRKQHPLLDVAVGFLGGITGGAAAFPGAFVTIWCGLKGWSKEQQRGVFQPFILITQIAGLVLLSLSGLSSGRHVPLGLDSLAYLPPMLLGTFLGMAVFKRLNDRQFAIAVNVLLIASGVSLIL